MVVPPTAGGGDDGRRVRAACPIRADVAAAAAPAERCGPRAPCERAAARAARAGGRVIS